MIINSKRRMIIQAILLIGLGIVIGVFLILYFRKVDKKESLPVVINTPPPIQEKEEQINYIQYTDTPTKCFSCENQFSPEQAWKGRPTKCFQCENQFVNTFGQRAGVLGQPSKFY